MGTILVVDDDADMLTLLEAALHEVGHETLLAASGAFAITQAVAHRPDLIVLDLLMPAMSGFEVCSELTSDPRTRDIPIVLLTGVSQTTTKLEGLACGAIEYVTKPFEVVELLARLHNLLAGRRRYMAVLDQLRDVQAELERRQRADTAMNGRADAGADGDAPSSSWLSRRHDDAAGALTPLEHTVLRGLAAGHAHRRIAVDAGVNERKVERVIEVLKDQVGASTPAALVAQALRRGLIT